jgi:hypothetical protein
MSAMAIEMAERKRVARLIAIGSTLFSLVIVSVASILAVVA